MKTFVQLRELAGRKPSGDVVFNKRVDRVPVKITKEMNKFVVYIDGDRLDAYSTQREAEKMAKEFVKQYKG
jgi:PHD/YefM family antitoxin component YafN of YafNO toxin-antitoxin module